MTLAPPTPSIPGRSITWDEDAAVHVPFTKFTGDNSRCTALGLSDGRVLWMQSQEDSAYTQDTNDDYVTDPGTISGVAGRTSLWMGYAPDETTFLTQDDSVPQVRRLVLADTGQVNDRTHVDGQLFYDAATPDYIYFIWQITRIRTDSTPTYFAPDFPAPLAGSNPMSGTYVYRSSDLGATWENHGTIHHRETDVGGDSPGNVSNTSQCSVPYICPNGDWLVAFNDWGSVGSPVAAEPIYSIQRSTDNGATWADLKALSGLNTGFTFVSLNFSHTKNVNTGWSIRTILANSGLRNTVYINDESGNGTWTQSDAWSTASANFETFGSQYTLWDDGSVGIEGVWSANNVTPVGVYTGLRRIRATRDPYTYQVGDPDELIDVWDFDNWSGAEIRQTFGIYQGIDYYLLARHSRVIGIRAAICVPPRDLHIPHPLWRYGDRPDWFTDNWLAIEQWACSVNTAAKCQLHIPRKYDDTHNGDMANYNALRRWVDQDCLCCVRAKKHELPVPSKRWDHGTFTQTVRRWVGIVIDTCADTDP